jgi:hypothetical protein
VASQQELHILEMLIGIWQGMAQRAHDRAEQADSKPEGPSTDYWRGVAFAFELAVEQLSTSMASLSRPDAPESEPQPTNGPQLEVPEDHHYPDGLPTDAATWLQAIPLDARARRLLSVIRSQNGQWLKRIDIARLLGNKTLSSGDMVLLQSLTEQNYIEARQAETTAPSGSRWEYRAR